MTKGRKEVDQAAVKPEALDLDDLELIEELRAQGVLDPKSPKYNADIAARVNLKIKPAADAVRGLVYSDTVKELLASITETMKTVTVRFEKLGVQLPQAEKMKAVADAFMESFVERHGDMLSVMDDAPAEIVDLFLYFAEELDVEKKSHPELAQYKTADVYNQGFNDRWEPVEGPFYSVIIRAQERARADFEALSEPKEPKPPQKLINPTQHIMPNNLLMNELAGLTDKEPINAGAYDMVVLPQKARQPEISVYVMAAYEPEEGITSRLTPFERDVSDAIMSVWEQAGKEKTPAVFTARSLYRAMPGRGERPSEAQSKEIMEAVRKLMRLYLEIDATDELRKRRVIGPKSKYAVRGYYLQATEYEYRPNKTQSAIAWRIADEPIVLNYAKWSGQVLTVPAKYLAIEKVKDGRASGEILRQSPTRQAMVSQMLRRIAVMKHDVDKARDALRDYDRRRRKDSTLEPRTLSSYRTQSDTILFSNIFKAAEIGEVSRPMEKKNREFCLACLDFWQVTGYIAGYKLNKKGQTVAGVTILHQ